MLIDLKNYSSSTFCCQSGGNTTILFQNHETKKHLIATFNCKGELFKKVEIKDQELKYFLLENDTYVQAILKKDAGRVNVRKSSIFAFSTKQN